MDDDQAASFSWHLVTLLELAVLLAKLPADDPRERDEARQRLEHALDELREMATQPALERALCLMAQLNDGDPRSRPPTYPDGLTAREVEVLGLMATGATNREIAAALHVTPGTVHQHLVNIFAKIGARRRAAAAVYATRHGLAPPA